MTNQNPPVAPSNGQASGQARGRQEIKIADNIPGAEYANAMQINHNKDEMQMMFLNIMGLTGRVTGKIITSPGHFKRMIVAMEDNLKKYEERFGQVKEAERPDKEIGFKV